MMVEALGDAGVKQGLQRSQAYQLAAGMLKGTGALLLQTGEHPAVLKDAVCSPKGTTIKGVEALEENGMRHALMAAVDAAQSKTAHTDNKRQCHIDQKSTVFYSILSDSECGTVFFISPLSLFRDLCYLLFRSFLSSSSRCGSSHFSM